MTDRMDQERIAEIPLQQDFVLARFLRELPTLTNKKKDFSLKNILNTNYSKKNKIFPKIKEIKDMPYFQNAIEVPLHRINPLILERQDINRRVDQFIEEEMRRVIPQRAAHPLPLDNLPAPDSAKKSFRSPTGLSAAVKGYPLELTIKGEKVVFENGRCTEINFMPDRRNRFDFSKITDSLRKGMQGVVDLLDAINQGRFEAEPVFVGFTNINMALIAQRLGFVIVDECRTPDGKINRDLGIFTIVGKLKDIRARVEEFKKEGVAQRLEQRNQRLQGKPKLAPAGT